MALRAAAYVLESPKAPLAHRQIYLAEPGPGEAVVEVIACGLCHTDLGYADGSVSPRKSLPLILGHEVVGRVIAAGEQFLNLLDSTVLVPAVLPCGACPFCRAGRGNACPNQKMPGNDIDGGFATHLLVPAHSLIRIGPGLSFVDLRSLCVVADATSTAYQAVRRAGLGAGDLAVVVGVGGVGGFVVQIAHALEARVVACDVRPERLKLLASHGAEETLALSDREIRDVRQQIRDLACGWGIPSLRHRIFECSGTPGGQILAYSLLDRGSTMVQVGYTPQKIDLRLSNLMAFDATIHGTWGCPPEVYPEVLRLIEARKVQLEPFVEHAPMSRINDLLNAMASHRLERRMILNPRT